MSTESDANFLMVARQAVGNLTGLASLPEVTAQIIKLVENPRTTPADLRNAVAHDPALVARVLKVVNSSYFSLNARVDSLERAIVLLGINAVKNLAVAAGLGQMFRMTQLCSTFTAKDLWTHCVGVAVVSRELARRVYPKQADEAFLAGMVHDLGILAALQLWPEKLRTVCESVLQSGGNFLATERQEFGTDHQYLGRALAEQWRFPPFCQVVAGAHHAGSEFPAMAKEDASLVALIRAADVICCRSKHGFNLTARQDTDEVFKPFDPAVVRVVTDKVDALLDSSATLFN